ncbi:GlmU family protein [Rapidithrix thailandica]|uniref:GlmU family protein n=1 Tax=Rapidithrix thailandica TaxID=413964 RepID=A0AAW9S9E4_9BACT
MNLILFDEPENRLNLLPFTFTRPVADIRVGILKIAEKWKLHLQTEVSFLTESYLQEKYPTRWGSETLFINGSLSPTPEICIAVQELGPNEALQYKGELLAWKTDRQLTIHQLIEEARAQSRMVTFEGEVRKLDYLWDIFLNNRQEIIADFKKITHNRKSQALSDPHTIVYGKDNLFLEEGVKIKAAIINAEDFPVYIGKNARINEGAIIQGAFALCEGAEVKVGAKIRADNTIGPYSKVGGEVSNSVILGYSNKGHDGYLGNAVLGEWCNLGADTNNSNLKNNYGPIKMWNYRLEDYLNSEQNFCGLMMGDHSKCGINTMFNTGTVVGTSCNIFGGGFPPRYIPSFSWGGSNGFTTARPEKMMEVADRVMGRRGLQLSQADRNILNHIFEATQKLRDKFGTLRQ